MTSEPAQAPAHRDGAVGDHGLPHLLGPVALPELTLLGVRVQPSRARDRAGTHERRAEHGPLPGQPPHRPHAAPPLRGIAPWCSTASCPTREAGEVDAEHPDESRVASTAGSSGL